MHDALIFATRKMAEHPTKVPALDGIRGLAILMVMISHFIFHTWEKTGWYRVLQAGWLGVDLFFVLSGFLITGILLDTRQRSDYFSRFYKRRVLRIFPLYFFAIALVWLCVVFIEGAGDRLHGYDSWWWYVFFASNVAMALKNDWTFHSKILDANHLWSIAVEEQFYLVWPFVVRWMPKIGLLILCAGLVHFSTTIRHLTDDHFGQAWSLASYMLTFCRLDGLAAGAFLAIFFKLAWEKRVPHLDWAVRALLVWMAIRLFSALWHGATHYQGTMAAFIFGSVLFLSFNPSPRAIIRQAMEMDWLRHLGKYSYALYVFHHLPRAIWEQHIVEPLLANGINPFVAQFIYFGLAFGMTYGLARLSWRFIEEPFLRLKT